MQLRDNFLSGLHICYLFCLEFKNYEPSVFYCHYIFTTFMRFQQLIFSDKMISEPIDSNPKSQSQELNNQQKNLDVNVGKWTNEENLKYAIFMDFHKKTLSSRHKKKDFKFFEEMSRFIVSRNTVQCRSHHQKIQERFKHFKKIISAVKNQMGRKQYKNQFKKWTNNGQSLVIEEPKIKENSDLSQISTKKQSIKEQVPQIPIEVNNPEPAKTQEVYPLLALNNFYNPFGFSLPSLYPFSPQYYC